MTGLLPPIGFAAPWLLWALLALPLVWFLLRVLPPAPILRRFPGVALLLGLRDDDSASARTPPWLLVLRLAALAAAILGFAGPILRPADQVRAVGPLLILTDAGWSDGDHWADLSRRLRDEVTAADAAARPLALVNLSGGGASPAPVFGPANAVQDRLRTLLPAAWPPGAARMRALAATLPAGQFDTLWQSDGLEQGAVPDADRTALLAALLSRGEVRALVAPPGLLALTTPALGADGITTRLLRPAGGNAEAAVLLAFGPDPTGAERELARQTVALALGATEAAVTLTLPPELRNRLTRIEVAGRANAGAVLLADDGLKRRKVGLVKSAAPQEGLELLSPDHYLRQALTPGTDLIEGSLADLVPGVSA